MSLSFDKGDPVAIIKGGKHNDQILFLDSSPPEPIQLQPKKQKKQTKMPSSRHIDDILEELCDDLTGYEKVIEMDKLRQHIIQDIIPLDVDEFDNYNKAKQYVEDNASKELFLDLDSRLVPMPDPNKRNVGYLAGKSGSGKSTQVTKISKEYRKLHPKNKIYLFSKKTSDPELDKVKPIRIPMSYDALKQYTPSLFASKKDKKGDEQNGQQRKKEEDHILNFFKNSLVIFDDTDTIIDKNILNSVNSIRNVLLETGRENRIDMLITSHLMNKGQDTRTIFNETDNVTFFPHQGNTYPIKYYLKAYLGMSKDAINKILLLPSRWVQIHTTAPMAVIHEAGAYIL